MTVLQGTVPDSRKRGGQRQRLKDNKQDKVWSDSHTMENVYVGK
jgi:hypothetical protein